MKKLISLVIVIMMAASSIVPVFAMSDRDSIPTPTEVNTFSVWARDTEFDPENDQFVDIYVNIANNTEYSCEYLKFYVLYPECLSLDFMEASGITKDTELTSSSEKTIDDIDNQFERALMTLYGYDVGVAGNRTREQQATFNERAAELLTGYKWTTPLLDFDRKTSVPNPNGGRPIKVNTDLLEEGEILLISFTYDASLNPDNKDLEIKILSDPEGGLHCTRTDIEWEYSNEWAYYEAYGCTVDLPGNDDPLPCEHKYDEGVVTTAATCTESGVKTFTCSLCGAAYTETIDPLGHLFTNYVSDGNATYEADGTKTAVCDRGCGATDTIPDPGSQLVMPGEPKVIVETVKASPGDKGVEVKVSIANNPGVTSMGLAVYYDQTALTLVGAADTKWMGAGTFSGSLAVYPYKLAWEDGLEDIKVNGDIVTLKFDVADNASSGLHNVRIVCIKDFIYNVDMDEIDFDCVIGGINVISSSCEHDYVTAVTAPTCTERGFTTHTCSRCGDSYVDTYVDALGHSFTNYVPDGNATCTADGTKTAKCDRCDATDTIADEGSALGHSFTNYVSNNDATCTADGTKTATCDRCDAADTIADVGSALGHDYAAVVTAPTCTEQGYTTHTCSRCNDTYVDTYVDALGHSFTNYVSDGNATCTEDGTKTAKCDRCDATDTIADEGSALGHDFSDSFTVDVEPTSTTPGVKSRHCSRCDEVTDVTEIPKLGIMGDVNGDGVVNLKDATLIRRYYVGGWDVELDEAVADVNHDGVVNLKDATLIRRYYVGGWGVEF